MADLLQVSDLEKAKLHDTFHSEAITGKAGGLASGTDINFATNAVTGQVQATLPYILKQIGGVIEFDFATGGTLNLRREFVQDATFGVWQWTGVLPHVVAPATDPTLDEAWVMIYTRSAAEITKAGGGSLQDTANTVDKLNATNYMSIYLYGGSPYKTGAENLAALRAAKAATGSVYFPNVDTGGSTYLIDGLTASDMLGLRWYADDLVTISLDSDSYEINTGSTFITDVNFYYRDKQFSFLAKANAQATEGVRAGVQRSSGFIDGVSEFVPDTELRGLAFDSRTNAVFSPIAITDNIYFKSLSAAAGKTAGLFTNIAIGETISAVVNNKVFSNNKVGVCVKSNTGYYIAVKDPTLFGGPIVVYANNAGVVSGPGALSYPNQGVLSSYELQHATLSVTRVSATECRMAINGEDLGFVFLKGFGQPTEVGFIAESLTGDAVSVDVFGISRQRSVKMGGVAQFRQLLVYGDSMADDFNGSFHQYLKQAVNGVNGAQVFDIVNRAVAGTTLTQAKNLILADAGTYTARVIVLVSGANDVQGTVSLADSLLALSQITDYCTINDIKLIVVEPYMWYPRDIDGIDNGGQNTARYEFAAILRSCMQYETSRRSHTYLRTTQVMPRPDPNLLLSENDPVVRDNIHQSQMSMMLYAENIADSAIHTQSEVKQGWMELPKLWLAAGVTAGNDAKYLKIVGTNKIQLRGTFTLVPPLSNGANILNIPMVVSGGNFPSVSTDLSTTSACYVNVNDSGVVTLQQIQSSLHNIVIFNISV